ncbi:hypothetical protein [Nitrosomonas sp. Nm33]|uniref:hypothetical protein n=1 Tax=Nitrosomonas sp. Nm33 TaxID=133724 RepID=UPI001C408CE7|nr:hypothetical protein [Nitrosomonas sp. Nm33]
MGTVETHYSQIDFPNFQHITVLTDLRKQFPVSRHGRRHSRSVLQILMDGEFAETK